MFKKIIKDNHFLSLSTNGFNALFGLLSFMFIARAYDKQDFGLWILYLTGFSFVEMLKAGIVHTALVKFLSGASAERQKAVIGSSWLISLLLNSVLIGILYLSFFVLPEKIESVGLHLFFKYYPLLALANLPVNYANWIYQAKEDFRQILFIRLGVSFIFLLVVTANLWASYSIEMLVRYHVLIHFVLAVSLLIRKKSGLQFLKYARIQICRKLLRFGKYSLGTLIGTNLLKSADTFLISLFLGPAFVAMYSVPLRLTEMLEIPLRSLVANALPKISMASNNNDMPQVKAIFYRYAGILSILFIPFMVIAFVFAEELVTLVGGPAYIEAANVFRIFCVYGLFLSLDRFTGVTLDAINRPQFNFKKVIWMAGANVVGDVVVILTIREIWAVALITVLNVLVGVILGYIFLKQHLPIRLGEMLHQSWHALKLLSGLHKKPIADKSSLYE